MTIAPVEVPGFDFVKQDYQDLLTRFRSIPGYTEESLGTSYLGIPIYGYRLTANTGKPMILVDAEVHGSHEWRTCYWVSEFMKLINDPNLSPDPAMFARLKSKFDFYFLPASNPDGYGTAATFGPYQNGNGVNLNRNFGYLWENGNSSPASTQYRGPAPFSEPETQIIRDKFLQITPYAAVSCHSWGGNQGFTVLVPNGVAYGQQARDVHQATKEVLNLDSNSYVTTSIPEGHSSNWYGQQLNEDGLPVFAFTIESGDQPTPTEQARMGMTGLLSFLLMAEYRLESPPDTVRKRRDLFSSQYLYLV